MQQRAVVAGRKGCLQSSLQNTHGLSWQLSALCHIDGDKLGLQLDRGTTQAMRHCVSTKKLMVAALNNN